VELRNLGDSDLRVSVIGLGCNNVGSRTGFEDSRVIHRSLDRGITFFDRHLSRPRRVGDGVGRGSWRPQKRCGALDKIWCRMDDAGLLSVGGRRYLMSALEASLRRLKTDWIDLYQLYIPDPLTPLKPRVPGTW